MSPAKPKGFLCVVCQTDKRSKKKHIKPFRLCGNCYLAIRERPLAGNGSGLKEKPWVEKCSVCDRPVKKHKMRPVCDFPGCRSLFYKNQQLTKQIDQAIASKNEAKLGRLTVKTLYQLGYKLNLSKTKD